MTLHLLSCVIDILDSLKILLAIMIRLIINVIYMLGIISFTVQPFTGAKRAWFTNI